MKSEKGSTIIEVLIALVLLGIVGLAFLNGLGTVSAVTLATDKQETAKNLAESQMEYAKSLGFADTYEPAPIAPEYVNYTVTINVDSLQSSNIQRITITVSHAGVDIVTLEGYKVR